MYGANLTYESFASTSLYRGGRDEGILLSSTRADQVVAISTVSFELGWQLPIRLAESGNRTCRITGMACIEASDPLGEKIGTLKFLHSII
jgi:hypothetical protein